LYGPGDDTTQPLPAGDAGRQKAVQSSVNAIQTDLARLGAKQTKLASSDRNITKPILQRSGNKQFFDAAPVPLKRLFGSPLLPVGGFAWGPNKERHVNGTWGDPRKFNGKPEQSTHPGLDFAAVYGESVHACADGNVRFVGCQMGPYLDNRKSTSISIKRPHQDAPKGAWKFILDDKENIVLRRDGREIGDGGIFVTIRHNGDFEGYQTEYFHLALAVVKPGPIKEGQLIGYVGQTALGRVGPHLHFQVAFVGGGGRQVVNPVTMVPHIRKNPPDSLRTPGVNGVILPPFTSVALQLAASHGANMLNASARGTALLNQGTAEIKQCMSTHAQNSAQITAVQGAAVSAAAGAANATALAVTTPMTFDFAKGTWTDGRPT
jgi:murein DD-endopeptidase MepM/ murein hydrolase activator NlpD